MQVSMFRSSPLFVAAEPPVPAMVAALAVPPLAASGPPLVRFQTSFGNDVGEGAGSLTLRLVLSQASQTPVTVTLEGPGYRQGDMDIAPRTVTFQPGQTVLDVSFAVQDDTIYEGDEVFAYQITSATGATIDLSDDGNASRAYGYIRDNDAPSGPLVRFQNTFGNDVGEGAGSLTLRLVLSQASQTPVTVTLEGPGYRQGDMDIAPRTVTFQPGQTILDVSFAVQDDTIYEGDEVFAYQITSATGATVDLSDNGNASRAYGYIRDNDVPTGPLVRFQTTFGNDVGEGAGSLTLRLVLSQASQVPVTVTLEGPGYRQGDMDIAPRTVTFQPGQTVLDVSFAVQDDTIYEGDEVFAYQITSATGATIDLSDNGNTSRAYGYIRDNDTAARRTVNGSAGNDTITGSEASDELLGAGGNDFLQGAGGDDTLNGGAGSDTVSYADAPSGVNVALFLGGTQTFGAGVDTYLSIENVIGSVHDDHLLGDAGTNRLTGLAGDDRLEGREGDDLLEGGAGNDVLVGGEGVDVASYADSPSGVNVALFLGGTQTFGSGLDRYEGVEGVLGSAFGDHILGDAGVNYLAGEGGADRLEGREGDDLLEGGAGDDALIGGSGVDTIVYARSGSGVNVALFLGGTNTFGAGIDAYDGVENVVGSQFGDHLLGDAGGNRLQGQGGGDQLEGREGADLLEGEAGDDVLIGGAGMDSLYGGAGVDRFVYATPTDSTAFGADRIHDFNAAEDMIDLSALDADTGVAGDQAFVFVGSFSGQAGQATLSYDAGSDSTLLSLDLNGDGAGDMYVWINGQVSGATGFLL